MCKNSYFQLNTKNDGTYLTVYPSADGGDELKFPEVSLYLMKHKVGSFDLDSLKRAITSLHDPVEVKLNENIIPAADEELFLKTSPDKMQVTGKFYCASSEGKQLSKREILDKLKDAGIVYGLISDNIDRYIEEKEYCTDILLAEGTQPEASSDAVVTYTFQSKQSMKPTQRSDGTVDFYQLDLINHVKSGEVLAVRTPPYEGNSGTDVYGNPKASRKPVERKLLYGSGVTISPDECKLFAGVTGHVILENDKLVVTSVYKINCDVGTSTGNISYDGSVEITGDVISNFVVEATGNIFVGGCVEGATLIAGDQIILSRGIHGGNKGKLVAGGNIAAKFIENCVATAGGNVSTDAILYSKVTANGDIIVNQNKGLISGGELRSGSSISAKIVGSQRLGASTSLEVGISPHIIERYRELEKAIIAKQMERKKLQQVITFFRKKVEGGEKLGADKQALIKSIPTQVSVVMDEINQMLGEYSKLKMEVERTKKGKIIIENAIHPGSKVTISNVSYYVRDTIYACQIVIDGAEIKFLKGYSA